MAANQFRKKPVVVEATQWFKNGDHPEDDVFRPFEDTGKVPTSPREGRVVRYFRSPTRPGIAVCKHCDKTMHHHGWIDTLQGGHTVCPGDWIITQPGTNPVEYYPCKPGIFAETYEDVAQSKKSGWVIKHADGKRWRTMDTIGMPDWTDDPEKALVCRLREHIEAYAEDDPEDIRIVEIQW